MFCVFRSSNSLCKLHIVLNFALAKIAAAMNSKTAAVSPSEAAEGCNRYKEGDDKVCFKCGSKSDTWLGLLRHIRGHGAKAQSYSSTWLGVQSRNEERGQERTRYQANAQKKKAQKKGSWTHRQRTKAQQHTKDTHDDGAPWVEALCWVKATADGAPRRPLVFGGLVADGPPKFGGKAHHAADEKTEEREAQSAVGDNVLVPAAIPIVDVPSSADVPSRPGSGGGTFEQLVAEIRTMVDTLKTDPTRWREDLPKLRVKPLFKHCALPPAKGEEGCKRATWPKDLVTAGVGVRAFADHLADEKNNQKEQQGDHLRGMSRVFDMLEIVSHDTARSIETEEQAADPRLMVALYTTEVYRTLLALPILDLKYVWAGKIQTALAAFIKWQRCSLTEKMVHGEPGPWAAYSATLYLLLQKLEGGYAKRAAAERQKRLAEKQEEDLGRIRGLPSVTRLQDGVLRGYVSLKRIESLFQNHSPPLPVRVQGEANACIVGAIWCDMFGGRKSEWQSLKLRSVQAMLEADTDFLTFKQHKTSRTYGTLAKWVSPGARQAFACYLRLPRALHVDTFLCPTTEGTAVVDIPSALRTFGRRHLPSDSERPTVNLMRKYFHKTIIKMTETEEKLKKVMEVVDAHSKRTIDKHYALREPEQDIALAKLLVKAVFRDTVVWPAEDASDGPQEDLGTMVGRLQQDEAEAGPDAPRHDDLDDSDDDIELQTWDFAEVFGVYKNVPVLCDTIDDDGGHLPLGAVVDATDTGGINEEAGETDSTPAARPKRRRRAAHDGSVLDKYHIVRTGLRTTLTPEQQWWADAWLVSQGYHRSHRIGTEKAEECVAAGIDNDIWGTTDPPTSSAIRTRSANLDPPDDPQPRSTEPSSASRTRSAKLEPAEDPQPRSTETSSASRTRSTYLDPPEDTQPRSIDRALGMRRRSPTFIIHESPKRMRQTRLDDPL